MTAPPLRQGGFTLTELAIAVAIIALLLGGLLATLDARNEAENLGRTQRTLDVAREALLGFAVQNGRLPCPATAASGGREAPDPPDPGTGACTQFDGFLPAVTLGLTPRDAAGFAVDAWNNRIRYRVSTASTNAYTRQGRLRNLGFSDVTPDIEVCVPSLGAVAAGGCPADFARILTAAVVVSPGRNFILAGAPGADEAENTDGDVTFFARPFSDAGSARGEYDDLVVWIPTNIFYGRLISAGPY